MKPTLPTVLSLCCLCAGLAVRAQDSKPAAGPPAPPFEGTRWVVVLKPDADGEKAGEKAVEDTLVFADSKLLSLAGKAQGFPAAKYDAGQKWAHAEIHTPDQRAKCEWRLEPAETEIQGTMVATRTDGAVVRYTVAGQKATVLDGTRWAIQIEPDAAGRKEGEKHRDDTLVFTRNRVSSTTAGGLPPVTYTVGKGGPGRDPDMLLVSADVQIEHDGRVRWTAEFKGDTVKGMIVTSSTGGSQRTQLFQGKRIAGSGDGAPNEAGVRIQKPKDDK